MKLLLNSIELNVNNNKVFLYKYKYFLDELKHFHIQNYIIIGIYNEPYKFWIYKMKTVYPDDDDNIMHNLYLCI